MGTTLRVMQYITSFTLLLTNSRGGRQFGNLLSRLLGIEEWSDFEDFTSNMLELATTNRQRRGDFGISLSQRYLRERVEELGEKWAITISKSEPDRWNATTDIFTIAPIPDVAMFFSRSGFQSYDGWEPALKFVITFAEPGPLGQKVFDGLTGNCAGGFYDESISIHEVVREPVLRFPYDRNSPQIIHPKSREVLGDRASVEGQPTWGPWELVTRPLDGEELVVARDTRAVHDLGIMPLTAPPPQSDPWHVEVQDDEPWDDTPTEYLEEEPDLIATIGPPGKPRVKIVLKRADPNKHWTRDRVAAFPIRR